MVEIKNKVIIWGVDGFNTLSLLRALGQGNLDILFLIKGKGEFAFKSKYCTNYVETNSVKEGYKFLLDNFQNEEYKPIIFTSGDDIMVFIDQHKSELEKYFVIPGTLSQGCLEKYTDKNEMTTLANELGITCPKSVKVIKGASIEAVEYPCLIKPAHEKIGHYNEFKFKKCNSKKKLKNTLNYVRSDSEFIVQEFIPQKEELLIYGCRMWDDSTVIAGAIIHDRMASSGTSHGYLTKEIPKCADISKIKAFLERINYHGLFSFEYGLFDGKSYFFEVNLRNDGTAHYFFQAGTNLPLAYVYSVAGVDYSEIPIEITKKQWFIDEIFDIENVILRKVKRGKWKQDLSQATIFKYFDENDRIPYEIAKKRKIKKILRNIILKRFRLYIVFVLDKFGLRK